MVRLPLTRKKRIVACLVIYMDMLNHLLLMMMMITCFLLLKKHIRSKRRGWNAYSGRMLRELNLDRTMSISDLGCIENTRMERRASHKLCDTSEQVKRSKHLWNAAEDAKLVECLLDLLSSGHWKGDTRTFRAGYAKQIEKRMHEKLLGCGVKAIPHIKSRVKQLKKQYFAIAEMLSLNVSGFRWDDKEKCVIADQYVFQDWVKIHPNAKGLRNKSFPHFDDLAIIFGKDRATGANAKGPIDAVEEIDKEEDDKEDNVAVEADLPTGLDNSDDFISIRQDPKTSTNSQEISGKEVNGNSQGNGSNEATKGKKRAGTSDDIFDQLIGTMDSLGNLYQRASVNISKLVSCFQFELEGANRRMRVFEEILKLDGFSDMERLKAGELLTADESKTDYFFSLPENYKKLYLQRLLFDK